MKKNTSGQIEKCVQKMTAFQKAQEFNKRLYLWRHYTCVLKKLCLKFSPNIITGLNPDTELILIKSMTLLKIRLVDYKEYNNVLIDYIPGSELPPNIRAECDEAFESIFRRAIR